MNRLRTAYRNWKLARGYKKLAKDPEYQAWSESRRIRRTVMTYEDGFVE